MRRLEHVVTPHNDVDVVECEDGTIDFDVIGATHATWHPVRLMTGHAWDALAAGALMHPGKPESLLLLGLGGGTVLRQIRHFLPELEITAVEIDPEMVRLARDYMALDTRRTRVVVEDAWRFLRSDTQGYDIILDDLYRCGDRDVERPHAVSHNSVRDLRARLRHDGVLAMNFVLGRGHAKVHRAARGAFLRHFASVRAVRPPLSHNEVLVGADRDDGLRSPRSLRALGDRLPQEKDRRLWKELRNLKLR